MTKKRGDDLDFDDFNLDDFEDFGEGGFDSNPPPDNRKASTKLVGSLYEGIKSNIKDPSNQARFIKKSLPKGYSSAVDAVGATASTVKQLYDAAARESKPVVKDLKKGVKMLLPGAKSILPKGMASKLEAWADDMETSRDSSIDVEESEIAMTLGTIFSSYQEQQKQRDEEAEAKQNVRDVAAIKQGTISANILKMISKDTNRLVSYQDQVAIQTQRKMLELQYRQLFTQRKLLDVGQQQLELSKTSFEHLVKNTGLPEVVKIHNSELALQLMKERTFGAVTDPMSRWFSGVGRRIVSKGKAQIKDFFQDVGGQISEAVLMGDMMKDAMGDSGISGKDMALEMGGSMAGSSLASWAAGKIAKPIRKRLESNPKIAAGGLALSRLLQDAPGVVNEWAKSSTSQTGFIGWLMDFMKDAVGTYNRDETVQRSVVPHLDQKVEFNLHTRRAITEVIPGWLSKIHHELYVTRTRDTRSGPERYDYTTGTFKRDSEIQARIKSNVYNKGEMEHTRDVVGKLVDSIDPDKKLSPEARNAISKFAMKEARAGRRFTMAQLAGEDFPDDLSKYEDEISSHVKDQFGYNENAKRDSMGRVMNPLGPWKMEPEYQRRLKDVSDKFAWMQNVLPDQMEKLLQEARLGNSDLMEKAGLLRRENKDSGTLYANEDSYFEQMLNGVDSQNNPQPSGNNSNRRGNRKLGRRKPIRRAAGGPIYGPGGPRDDKVLMYGSNKEFVLNAGAMNIPGMQQFARYANSLGNKVPSAKMVGMGNPNDRPVDVAKQISEKVDDVIMLLKIISDKPSFGIGMPGGFSMGRPNLSWAEEGILGGYRGAKRMMGSAGKRMGQMRKDLEERRKKWSGRAMAAGGMAWNTAKDLGDRWMKRTRDIFNEQTGKVLLKAADIQKGLYIDVNTGKIIERLQDITGEVKNRMTGETVVGPEGIKDLYTKFGNGLIERVTGKLEKMRQSIKAKRDYLGGKLGEYGKKIYDFGMGKLSENYGTIMGLPGKAKDAVMGAFDRVRQMGTNAKDAVKNFFGNIGGKLTFGLFSSNRTVVTRLEQIYMLLNDRLPGEKAQIPSDFGKGGTFSINFSGLPASFTAASASLKQKLGGFKDRMKGYRDRAKRGGEWARGKIGSWADKIKKNYLDADGDGDVDNSTEDIRKRKEEAAKSGAENSRWGKLLAALKGKGGGDGEKKSGFNIMDLFSKLKGFSLTGLFAGAASLISTAASAISILKGAGGSLLGKLMGKIPGFGGGAAEAAAGAGKKGLLRRAGGWIAGKLGQTVTKRAVGGLALRAGAMALGGLGVVGGVLGTALTAAVSLPGLAIGLGLYGAYKLYQKYNKDNTPIARFRMAQYGFEHDDEDSVKKIIELESQCKALVVTARGQPAKFGPGKTAMDLMPIFGIDTEDTEEVERWLMWFMYRFKPVFLAHATVLFDLTGKNDITTADESMTTMQKLEYLNRVHFTGSNSPYTIMANPLAGEDEVDLDADDVKDAHEDALDEVDDNASENDKAYNEKINGRKPEEKKSWWQSTKDATDSLWSKTKASLGSGYDKAVNWTSNKMGDISVARDAAVNWTSNKMAESGVVGGVLRAVGKWSSKASASLFENIRAAAAKYGVSEQYLRTMAYIESKGDASAVSPTGAKGIYQFTKGTGAQYGLIKNGVDMRGDEAANVDAGARFAKDNADQIRRMTGRQPEPWMLYLAHQQGIGGLTKIMRAAMEGKDVDPKIRYNMDVNGGRGLTPAQFLDKWKADYASKEAAASGGKVATIAQASVASAAAKPLTTPTTTSAPPTTSSSTPTSAPPVSAKTAPATATPAVSTVPVDAYAESNKQAKAVTDSVVRQQQAAAAVNTTMNTDQMIDVMKQSLAVFKNMDSNLVQVVKSLNEIKDKIQPGSVTGSDTAKETSGPVYQNSSQGSQKQQRPPVSVSK